MSELDDRLREAARTWLDAETASAAATVDADLSTVLARSDGLTAAGRTADPSDRRRWLMAASIAAVVAGAVAVLATVGGDDELSTSSSSTSTSPGPIASSPPTTIPTTNPTSIPTPSASPPATTIPIGPLAVAAPTQVAAGEPVTITPSSVVQRRCNDIVTISSTGDTEPTAGQLLSDGTWLPATPSATTTVPACLGVTTSEPLTVVVPGQLTVGGYVFCIAARDIPEGCAAVTVVEPLATAATAPVATTQPPVLAGGAQPYVVRRFLRFDEIDPLGLGYEVRDIAADGTDLGPTDADVRTLTFFPVDIGGGRRLGLTGFEVENPADGRRCVNQMFRATTAGDPAELPDIERFGQARSVAGNEIAVVVGRDVCPDGARWGDPGTYFELVRYDLATPAEPPVQLARIEPDPEQVLFDGDGTTVYATGDLIAATISPDGRYVGVQEPYNPEQSRWHVYSAVAPGGPITLGSRCDTPGDLVGPPRFVSNELVVVARECGRTQTSSGELFVEAPTVDEWVPRWSQRVEGARINDYSGMVSSLSAVRLDGDVWVIVSGAGGVDDPVTATMLHGDDEFDITRPDGRDYDYAFTAADILPP